MRNLVIAAAVLAVATPALAEPLGFSGSLNQNFDNLTSPQVGSPAQISAQVGRGPHDLDVSFQVTGFTGWFGANPGGSISGGAFTEFKAHNGSLGGANGRGVLSHGATGSTDRALGAQSTSNQVNTFGLILQNTTAAAIPSLNVAFTGEQWRRGNILASANPLPNRLRFTYSVFTSDPSFVVIDDLLAANPDVTNPPSNPPSFTTVDALTFFSPNLQEGAGLLEVALNGNAPENRRSLSSALTNLNWAPGGYIAIRWTAVDLSGQDDGLAIDDLVLSTSTTPAFLKGDFNFDGEVLDSDITGFVSALTGDFTSLMAQFPNRTEADFTFIGDFNGDSEVLDSDINGFVAALLGGGGRIAAIPEPTSLGLILAAVPMLTRRRK